MQPLMEGTGEVEEVREMQERPFRGNVGGQSSAAIELMQVDETIPLRCLENLVGPDPEAPKVRQFYSSLLQYYG